MILLTYLLTYTDDNFHQQLTELIDVSDFNVLLAFSKQKKN